jgi:hypothetical protein
MVKHKKTEMIEYTVVVKATALSRATLPALLARAATAIQNESQKGSSTFDDNDKVRWKMKHKKVRV